MINEYIPLLEQSINRLEQEDFDFEAWRSATLSLLSRIFGPDDPKLKEIKLIKIEYGSSWTIRDVTGSYDPLVAAKRKAKAILFMAIDELHYFGPKDVEEISLLEVIKSELSGSQFDELDSILKRDIGNSQKQQQIVEKLSAYDGNLGNNILARLMVETNKPNTLV